MKKLMPFKNQIFNLRFGIGLMALALTTSLSGCEELNGCGDVKPDILPCGTEVTVVAAGCASGAFQSRWLKLPNGELLQPFENKTSVTNIQVGQRFMIGYETMRRDNRYDGDFICQALPPKGTPVRLLCMNPIIEEPTQGCDTYATATKVICSYGAWGDTWLKLDDGTYLQPWNNATATADLKEGARYKIGYAKIAKDSRYDGLVHCDALPADPKAQNPEIVSVTCLEQVSSN